MLHFAKVAFAKEKSTVRESGGQGAPVSGTLYYPRQYLQYSDEMYNGKAIMCRTKEYKYIRRLYEKDEFYDLKKDPKEIDNRIDDPYYREIILEMKEKVLNHYTATCDVVPFQKIQEWIRDCWHTANRRMENNIGNRKSTLKVIFNVDFLW